jgi:hypothetical protein
VARALFAAGLSICLLTLAGCDIGTDVATRLAYDLKAAARQLGRDEGAKYSLVHKTPSKSGECEGRYKVQLDKVGALIIWCYDAAGTVVSSGSTSYHGRYVDTPKTWILDKPARSALTVDLERRGGRAVVTNVY